jgi:hypothetical protein
MNSTSKSGFLHTKDDPAFSNNAIGHIQLVDVIIFSRLEFNKVSIKIITLISQFDLIV